VLAGNPISTAYVYVIQQRDYRINTTGESARILNKVEVACLQTIFQYVLGETERGKKLSQGIR
jgi:hypothetical protein